MPFSTSPQAKKSSLRTCLDISVPLTITGKRNDVLNDLGISSQEH